MLRATTRLRPWLERLTAVDDRAEGLIATARTNYRERPLGGRFSEEAVRVPGGVRQVAMASGVGTPIVVVPGAFASFREDFFASIAERLAATGRSVLIVEDRLAADTLVANQGQFVSLAVQAEELRQVADSLLKRPIALAFSCGAGIALAVESGTFERVIAWSPAFDLRATWERVESSFLLRSYFTSVCARAFRGVRAAPSLAELAVRLVASPPEFRADTPLIAIHARNDPVVPIESVLRFSLGPQQRLVVRPRGGHLGFASGPDAGACVAVGISPSDGQQVTRLGIDQVLPQLVPLAYGILWKTLVVFCAFGIHGERVGTFGYLQRPLRPEAGRDS